MDAVFEFLREFNVFTVIIRLVLAMIFGGCVGLEREKYKRPAGFRTHIIVCIGSCMTSLMSIYVVQMLGLSSDAARLPAQVISGLGFLGVGTILVKGKDHIVGLTTAAGLWAIGIIGIACGYGFYVGALTCTAIMMISTIGFFHFESEKKERKKSVEVYVEVEDAHSLNKIIREIEEKYNGHNFLVVSPRSAMGNAVGIEVTFPMKADFEIKDLPEKIAAVDGVLYAVESTPQKLS